MVDALVFCEGNTTRTSFKIREDNIFLENGILSEAALIENIAQTAAARAGWVSKKEDQPAPIGYIGAVQQLEIFSLPKLNDELETETIVKNQIFNITVITGRVSCNGNVLAQCEMKIFITNQS
jgi:predicted hotdog family 3-hydroxylacyl-ACP dehydratase